MSDYFSKETLTNEFITVVSGLPRSGTSMMMKMLSAGNMPLLIDDIRMPDEDNPKGYFEFERVKDLENDNSWLEMARGKAVKIVSPLLCHLNLGTKYRYKIIFMLRNVYEILNSQKKMACRLKLGEDDIEDNVLMQNYSLHLREIQEWEKQKENIDVMYVNYADVITTPLAAVQRICNFLDQSLNTQEMSAVIDDSLYRQRVEKSKDYCIAVASEENKDNEIIAERLKHLGYL
jgi:hypothetical protein